MFDKDMKTSQIKRYHSQQLNLIYISECQVAENYLRLDDYLIIIHSIFEYKLKFSIICFITVPGWLTIHLLEYHESLTTIYILQIRRFLLFDTFCLFAKKMKQKKSLLSEDKESLFDSNVSFVS